jgi:UDP-glucose 4-epimerase
MMHRKIAVVGANGFIGSNLAKKLAEFSGNELLLFGRNSENLTGISAPYHQLDMSNREVVAEQFAGVDFVYFLASVTIPATSWNNPTLEITGNLLPFVIFLETLSTLSVKKVVFVSSAGTIYGKTDAKADEDAVKNPFSPYGITKLAMEYYLNYFYLRTGMNYDIFRVSNVYGEGQNIGKGLGIINTFLTKILTDHRIQIYGDGHNIRNYIYIKDLTTLMAFSLENNLAGSGIYNVSSNDTLSINELVAVIRKVVPADFAADYTPARKSDNDAIYLDNGKLLKLVPGFRFTSIEEGILQTYSHIRSMLG